jgi:gluconolactonase
MTLDERGNVYLTGDGVTVYDTAGAEDRAYSGAGEMDGEFVFWREGIRRPYLLRLRKGIYVMRMRVQGGGVGV